MRLISKEKIFILILILFSLLINQYYGNRGIFPVDSFAHFDAGFRILLGEHPFKDYWIVSGPFIDYIQAIFFYLFGVSWQSYVLHASLINGIGSAILSDNLADQSTHCSNKLSISTNGSPKLDRTWLTC